ncbi:MAG: GGDEF domain-containing protein, partial [Planctomycetes bacterium]|nr:GGDEF domain-containing protein [Planctomycetota bacterium]
ATAQVLEQTARKADTVCRYGGEEFVALAVLREPADAPIVCERVRAAVEACPVFVDDIRIPFTLSIGATTDLGTDFESMLSRADEGVYRAKETGRNRIVVM